ncbi:MAG: S-layer homology domain-containing protein [Clostridiales bacterium]|nr:S-layer homology domain-containing protein [Clostridiales bacterium]
MKKRILSVLLAVCLMATALPVLAASETGFPDMPQDYSTAALETAVANGLLGGADGLILPDAPLTRAQMAAIVVRAFGATAAAPLAGYADVSESAWYYADLGKAVQMKVLQGDGANLNPDDSISRQQAFAVLARALKLDEGTPADLAAFSDSGDVAAWAVGATAAMVKAGFIQGAGGVLNPTANISRKDFAVMMGNIVKTYIKTAGVVTELAEGTVLVNVPGVTLQDVEVKGDLIIGDGVGDGDVILDNVSVTGRMIVRGGGVNSIIIRGSSAVGTVVISKVDGHVRIAVEGDATVEVIYINDGKDDVIVEGNVDRLVVDAPAVPVTIQNGTVGEVAITAADAQVTVAKGAAVTAMTASGTQPSLTIEGSVTTLTAAAGAAGAKIEVAAGGSIDTVLAGAAGTTIGGEGSVKNATISGENVSVNTKGTEVTVVAGGSQTAPDDSGSTSGGSQTGGGGGNPPSSTKRLNVSVDKLGTAPDDVNKEDSQANQDAVTVSKSGNTVTVSAVLSQLKAFNSTNPDQGIHKWVGLVVDTGESSILGVYYGEYEFIQADVDEAATVEVGAGKFVLWVKADELAGANKTFKLSKANRTSVTITLQFQDPTAVGTIAAPLHDNAPEDNPYRIEDADMPTVTAAASMDDGTIVIALSADKSIPIHQNAVNTLGAWVGVAIPAPTGVTTGVTYAFGTEPSGAAPKAYSSLDVLDGKAYAIFYADISSDSPKTHITIDWDGAGSVFAPQKYALDIEDLDYYTDYYTSVDLSGSLAAKTATFFGTFYNKKPNGETVTIGETNKDAYFVEIGAYFGSTDPVTATIGGTEYAAGATYKVSVGNNRFIDHNIWAIESGKLYIALPYLCVETLPGAATEVVVGGHTFEVTSYAEEADGELTIASVDPLGTEAGYKNEATFNPVNNTVTQTAEHRLHYVGVTLKDDADVELGPDVLIFRKNMQDNSVGITKPEDSGHTYAVYGDYAETAVSEAKTLEKAFHLAIPGKGVIDITFVFEFEVPQP